MTKEPRNSSSMDRKFWCCCSYDRGVSPVWWLRSRAWTSQPSHRFCIGRPPRPGGGTCAKLA